MKKFTFLCLFAILASISAFAETTITWNFNGVVTSQTSGGGEVNTALKTSSITGGSGTWTAKAASSYANTSSSVAQLGSSSYPFNGTISLSESSIPDNAIITKITMTASTTKSGSYAFNVTVNGEAFGSMTGFKNTASQKSVTGNLVGNNIVFTATTYVNAFKPTQITVTYEDAPIEVESIEAFNALETDAKAKFTCPLTITASMPGKVFVQDAYGWHSALRGNPVNSASKFPSGSVIPAGLTGVKKSDNTLNITGYDETLGELTTGGSLILSNITYNQIKNAENIFRYVKISAVPVVTVYDSKYDVTYYYAYSTDVDGDGMTIYTPTVDMLENGKVYDLTGVIDYEDDHYLIRAFDSQEVTIAFDAPTISLEAGTYDKEQTVSFTLPDGATSIVYSIDDNVDLKTNGELWDGNVITINKSCTLRAIAADESRESFGAEASATYVMKTATPTITAAEAVDGAYNNEEGKLEVTISCPKYRDNVIIAYSVDGVEDTFEGTSKVITINGTATVKATALYADFDVSDEATATFTWNDPNVVAATLTGNIVIADQTGSALWGANVAEGTLTDIFGHVFNLSKSGSGNNMTINKNSNTFRMYKNTTVTFDAGDVKMTKIEVTKYSSSDAQKTAMEIEGWTVSEDLTTFTCNDAKGSQTITFTPTETNAWSNIKITYAGNFKYYKVGDDGAALIGMEKGKFYKVNVVLQGVKANDGVLYARTSAESAAPSKPTAEHIAHGYDSYEDINKLDNYDQRDWVVINGLGSEYEGKEVETGFIASYDGETLTSVAGTPAPGSQVDVELNTFGVANVFYGNYKNTESLGWVDGDGNPYKPFFVKAKVNEVANFVGKVTKDTNEEGGSFRLVGSGKCGVFEGKGVLLEAADGVALSESGDDYKEFKGVLVAETNNTLAQYDVKIVALSAPTTPTGVAALKADGKATVYGTEGAVVVNGADGKVMIFDAMGRMVKNVNVEGAATVAMPAGYYIVRTAGTAAKVMVK